MTFESTLESARDSAAKGVLGISAFGMDGMGVAEIIGHLDGQRRLRHGMIRVSTAGRIRRAGFEIVPTFDPPHQTIRLRPSFERDGSIVTLTEAFDAPVPRETLLRSGRYTRG